MVYAGDSVMQWRFTAAVTSVVGADPSRFVVDGQAPSGPLTLNGGFLEADYPNPGTDLPWSTPGAPTGLTFAGGGDVTASSGVTS